MNIVSSSAMVMIVTFQLIWSTIVFKITSIFFFYLLIRHTSCNLSMSPSLDLLNAPFHFKSPVYCEAVLLGFKRQNGLNVILKHKNAQLPESISWPDGVERGYFQKTYIESFSNFLTTKSYPQRRCLHQLLQITPHTFSQVHPQTILPLFSLKPEHFSLKYPKKTVK